MSPLAALGGMAGGLGLFLLGMGLMTDGLKLAAGPALERILARSTRTRWRGLASGVLVTSLVQSSSAVTVAVIGFVNAGLLNLSQALWVLFGANVGTTMTGWLVALVGLKFKIEVLALPLIGAGMLLRLTGERGYRGALGLALAGFGVLFLGIDLLKDAFSGLAETFRLPEGEGLAVLLAQVLVGVVLTVLMQSSSAALAIALTAAQGGMIPLQGATAVVIGANVGTTVTAILAGIGATPNAKRAAAAHILFNALTAVVALALLQWLVGLVGVLHRLLGMEESPAAALALFHTLFNVLGVILVWPVADRMTRWLEGRFRAAEEDEARPRYIDRTVLAVPALALHALERELLHLGEVARGAVAAALAAPAASAEAVARKRQAASRLSRAIAEFIVELNRAGMSADSANRLPGLLRVARNFEAAAELAGEAADARAEPGGAPAAVPPALGDFAAHGQALLGELGAGAGADAARARERLQLLESAYQQAKGELLQQGAAGQVGLEQTDARLRAASALRRGLGQLFEGAAHLARAGRQS